MSLSLDLATALQPLVGQVFAPPQTLTVADGSGVAIAVDLLGVERLGISCEELRLDVPRLSGARLDLLKAWAAGLCGRITYLLETLEPLEFDAQGQQVLIRSKTPDATQPARPQYYEVLLSSLGQGRFALRRFAFDRASGSRLPTPLDLTHQQLAKLVNDLVATLPTP